MTEQELLDKNMEQAGVIRALRKNTREDAETIERLTKERDEAREALREIAGASGFDNIGNWARKKARKALEGAK